MFCPKCGNQLNDGAAFCPKCGTKIEAKNTTPVPKANMGGLLRNKSFILGIVGIALTFFPSFVDIGSRMLSAPEIEAIYGYKKTGSYWAGQTLDLYHIVGIMPILLIFICQGINAVCSCKSFAAHLLSTVATLLVMIIVFVIAMGVAPDITFGGIVYVLVIIIEVVSLILHYIESRKEA